jgi:hypothetical protein
MLWLVIICAGDTVWFLRATEVAVPMPMPFSPPP